MTTARASCARELLETVPLVMRIIRSEMRSHRGGDMSVSQFRTMLFIGRTPGCSLSQVAGFLDLTLASTSKMVDSLVDAGLILRKSGASDRRKIELTLSDAGRTLLDEASQATQDRLEELLDDLSGEEQAALLASLEALRRVFSPMQKEGM